MNDENILWANIESSHLERVGYNIEQRTLYIDFLNGDTYKYNSVPAYKVLALLKAPSAGIYFWEEIRDSYSYEKV